MTARQFFLYLNQTSVLTSKKQLRLCEASFFPHMGETDRARIIEDYRQTIKPTRVDKKEVEDAWDFLKAKKEM